MRSRQRGGRSAGNRPRIEYHDFLDKRPDATVDEIIAFWMQANRSADVEEYLEKVRVYQSLRDGARQPTSGRTPVDKEPYFTDAELEFLATVRSKIIDPEPLPKLYTLNGIGQTLLGDYRPREMAPLRFAVSWFTFLYVPLLPTGIFLLDAQPQDPFPGSRTHTFYGELTFRDFYRLFATRGGVGILLRTVARDAAIRFAVLMLLLLAFATVVSLF